MRIRRRLLAGFVVLLGAVVVVFWFAPRGRHAEPVARPERPFVPLEAVVASDAGWELVAPPQLPGPYRPLGSHLVAAGHSSATSRVRNDAGAVVEEVRVERDPAFDHMVVFLDTASGGRTLVVLRRPR
jgi:hypothetical protein